MPLGGFPLEGSIVASEARSTDRGTSGLLLGLDADGLSAGALGASTILDVGARFAATTPATSADMGMGHCGHDPAIPVPGTAVLIVGAWLTATAPTATGGAGGAGGLVAALTSTTPATTGLCVGTVEPHLTGYALRVVRAAAEARSRIVRARR